MRQLQLVLVMLLVVFFGIACEKDEKNGDGMSCGETVAGTAASASTSSENKFAIQADDCFPEKLSSYDGAMTLFTGMAENYFGAYLDAQGKEIVIACDPAGIWGIGSKGGRSGDLVSLCVSEWGMPITIQIEDGANHLEGGIAQMDKHPDPPCNGTSLDFLTGDMTDMTAHCHIVAETGKIVWYFQNGDVWVKE